MMVTRNAIIATAQSYVGTPFHHRGRQPGLALDCAGLLICLGRELGIFAPDFDVPEYTMSPDGTMLDVCDQHMIRIKRSEMQPGDAIAIIAEHDPQHLGIVTDYRYGGFAIVHASNDKLHKRVIEHRLMFSPKFRFAAAWRFPGVD